MATRGGGSFETDVPPPTWSKFSQNAGMNGKIPRILTLPVRTEYGHDRYGKIVFVSKQGNAVVDKLRQQYLVKQSNDADCL